MFVYFVFLWLSFSGTLCCSFANSTNHVNQYRIQYMKIKWMKSRVLYYTNATATFNILICGDIHPHPGPEQPASSRMGDNANRKQRSSRVYSTTCTECKMTVRCNQKRFVCEVCKDFIHVNCLGVVYAKTIKSGQPHSWTCHKCLLSQLPFYGHEISETTPSPSPQLDYINCQSDVHLSILDNNSQHLKIMHINTQSMVSTFDELCLMIQRYSFDIITMSETWLKENSLLLQHVTIPGYVHAFNNRDRIRGGGVGVYIKDSIKFKRREDLEKRFPKMEHLWIEICGRNRYSKLLLGTIYRSEAIQPYATWLENFNDLLSNLTVDWDGMLIITGDFNVDLFRPEKIETKKYNEVLESMSLEQLVTKPTRNTLHSATLIDHIITNMKQQITHCDVFPAPLISDHDAPYVCVNVRVPRFIPRFKIIRNERHFNKDAFIKSFDELPLSLVYAVDDPDLQVDILNSLFRECLDHHAPLKRTKVSRPPAPWMKNCDVAQLQKDCKVLRVMSLNSNEDESSRVRYRKARNDLKRKIKSAKCDFYKRAFSSKNPKQVWKVIHRILHPNPKPLRVDPDELNAHFASTTERVTGATPEPVENLWTFIDSLADDSDSAFHLREVSYGEVLSEIRTLRSDCSCGPDGIPVKFIKLVAERLASPLTHILNNCISKQLFPSLWKIARICAIPKVQTISSKSDLRPISILPTLSKIFERLVLRQMSDFVTDAATGVLKGSVSAYRRGHNTTTVMLAMRDDIQRAMKRGEVTIAVFADFSKAFDTVSYPVILRKLHSQGFSKKFLKWITSYLTGRRQFVQIDDVVSSTTDVSFGVPQGSILGPVLFNLYVNDLSVCLDSATSSYQYADDTSFYTHCKPYDIKASEDVLQSNVNKLTTWSSSNNLVLNPRKTKLMVFSTTQMSRVHQLDEYPLNLNVNGVKLERTKKSLLLGTIMQQNLKWNDEIQNKISTCYKTLSVLRKLKHLAPFKIRKQLAECLVLSKLDYNDVVSTSVPEYLLKRLQRVQLVVAGFVLKKYASLPDILSLGWLPITERRDYHLAKLAFKAIHCRDWPSYLTIDEYKHSRNLRSSSGRLLVVPLVSGTFQNDAARVFNNLPEDIRNCDDYEAYCRLCLSHFKVIAEDRMNNLK